MSPRPRLYDEPPINTQVRFPRKLHAKLRAEANSRGLSVNMLVIRAVEDFLRNRRGR